MNIQLPRFLILSLALVTLTSAGLIVIPQTLLAQSPAPAAATPAAAPEGLRAEFAKHLVAAQEKIRMQQYKEALTKIADADLLANKTPYEIFVMERMRGTAAAATGEHAITVKSFEIVVATGRLGTAEQVLFSEALTGAYYNLRDYKQAASWAARSLNEGSTLTQTRMLLIQSLFLADDFAAAKKEIVTAIAIDEKANKTPSEDLLKMLGRTALKQNDQAGYIGALERLAVLYPSKEIWADLISRTANGPTMTDRYIQDLFRLQLALGEKLTEAQYMFLAQNAMQAGFPIDAKQILDNGFAAGVLGGRAEHKQLRDKSNKDADDDLKNMTRTSAEAAKGKEGPGLFNSGLNFVISGDKAKGLAMMEEGIKRAGIKRPGDAKLRLGITYLLAGEQAKAIEILAAISGPEGLTEVARVWHAFAKQHKQIDGAKEVNTAKENVR